MATKKTLTIGDLERKMKEFKKKGKQPHLKGKGSGRVKFEFD